MAVSGSSSVTKAPGTAAQGSPVSNQYQPPSIWANLSNIAVADGNYAEALSNANGIYVTNITVDGVNPVSVTKYVPTNIWTNSEWMVNTLGGPTDTWGYSISVSQVNSPNFGIILYPPACPSLTLTNFGFNIPDGNAINGIEFTIKTQSIYQQDNPLGCLPSIGCGILFGRCRTMYPGSDVLWCRE